MSVVSQVSKDCVLFCFELLGFYVGGIYFGGLYLWIILYIYTHIHTMITDTRRQFFSPVHSLPPFLHPALNCEANLRPQARSSK